jgi:acyl carrier protein
MAESRSWETFAAAIASSAQVSVDRIGSGTRLTEDLGLDSLALTELVVLLIVEFDMTDLADDLEARNWAGVTVGALYSEYRRGLETASA